MSIKQEVENSGSTAVPLEAFSSVHSVLHAVVCTVVPEASALDDPGWSELEALIELTLRDRPGTLQRQLRLFLHFIEWWPLLRYGRPFTSLRADQRRRFLSSLEEHPIRLIRVGFWGLRTLALLGYYGRPEAANAIGYAADPRGWEALG